MEWIIWISYNDDSVFQIQLQRRERDVVELHPYVNECIIFCLSVFEQYCGY